MIYLASPYTHPNPSIQQQRYEAIAHIAAHLLTCDVVIYSPILHCHPIHKIVGTPDDFNFWAKYNREMIRYSQGLIVVMLDGWKESVGVVAEMNYAVELGKQVCFFNVETKRIQDNA